MAALWGSRWNRYFANHIIILLEYRNKRVTLYFIESLAIVGINNISLQTFEKTSESAAQLF